MTPRILQLLLSLSVCTSAGAYADCGDSPMPPTLLEQAQLNANDVESLQLRLTQYFTTVEAYRSCVDQQISGIAPVDAPLEYFDSPAYQAKFDRYIRLSDSAESKMQLAVDRYNYLLVNATSAPE